MVVRQRLFWRHGRSTVSAGQFVRWHDLFAVVDDGAIPLSQYAPIEEAMKEQAAAFPGGIACLVILPPGAKPPPDDVKARVKALLNSFGPQLVCLAYVIEGSGFKAVAARAALIGMKVFMSRPYPVFVETSMDVALHKVLPYLAKGKTITTDPRRIADAIAAGRTPGEPRQTGSASRTSER
jgi:hypothetical protein